MAMAGSISGANGSLRRRVSILASGPVQFGKIPAEHWKQPDWINEDLAKESRDRMKAQRVPYADSVSYRNMCRWNSGVCPFFLLY